MLTNLGERYELEQIALRPWPGATPAQSALTAVFDLVAEEPPEFAAIERVRIEVPPNVHSAHERFVKPEGKFEALLSFHFLVAKVLRDRAFWLDSVEPRHVGDPELQDFMRDKIELAADPALTFGQSRVTVTSSDGKVRSAEALAAKGAPGNPAALEDLCAIYERCVEGRLSKEDAAELLERLVSLDEQPSLQRLLTLLGSAGQRVQ